MEALALVLAALLAVAAVLFVARPFLGEPEGGEREPADPEEGERLRLAEERDRALAALKELEFDHRTGKISDADYRDLVGPLRRRASEALRALEKTDRGEPPAKGDGPASLAGHRAGGEGGSG